MVFLFETWHFHFFHALNRSLCIERALFNRRIYAKTLNFLVEKRLINQYGRVLDSGLIESGLIELSSIKLKNICNIYNIYSLIHFRF